MGDICLNHPDLVMWGQRKRYTAERAMMFILSDSCVGGGLWEGSVTKIVLCGYDST